MLDYIDDDYITVDLNHGNLPEWFGHILSDILNYYKLSGSPERMLANARYLVDECLKKRGFEFEYYKIDSLKRSNLDQWGSDDIQIIPEGYVFKSTPELSAYILKVTGNGHKREC